MKKQLTIIIGLLLSSSITVHAQVAQKLRELGMENIRTIETGGTTVAAFEDNVYRGTYRGVGKAIIAGMEGMGNGNLELVALDGNGIPQLSISLPDTLIAGYKSGEISLKEVYERMEMSYDTDRPMGLLKGSTGVINRSAWKTDIVLYPEVSLENSTFDKLYSYRVNLSPAVEMDLWKGAKATAQVVFPIATNMKGEYKKIRPGVMTISQEIRFRNNFLARIVAGNFTDHRIGAQAEVKYRTGNGPGGAGSADRHNRILGHHGRWMVYRYPSTNQCSRERFALCTAIQYSTRPTGRKIFVWRLWAERRLHTPLRRVCRRSVCHVCGRRS